MPEFEFELVLVPRSCPSCGTDHHYELIPDGDRCVDPQCPACLCDPCHAELVGGTN